MIRRSLEFTVALASPAITLPQVGLFHSAHEAAGEHLMAKIRGEGDNIASGHDRGARCVDPLAAQGSATTAQVVNRYLQFGNTLDDQLYRPITTNVTTEEGN